jgi:hypothetical protein
MDIKFRSRLYHVHTILYLQVQLLQLHSHTKLEDGLVTHSCVIILTLVFILTSAIACTPQLASVVSIRTPINLLATPPT